MRAEWIGQCSYESNTIIDYHIQVKNSSISRRDSAAAKGEDWTTGGVMPDALSGEWIMALFEATNL
jgi:hypothetical protein